MAANRVARISSKGTLFRRVIENYDAVLVGERRLSEDQTRKRVWN